MRETMAGKSEQQQQQEPEDNSLFNHADDIAKQDALQLYADHLQGQWLGLDARDFELSVIQ